MCGIAAIYRCRNDAPELDRGELEAMRDAMVARGPDSAGLWVDEPGRVGLAHRRLAIIDLSEAGAQPMASADGRLRIVFNGEIYNYRELRRELAQRGIRLKSESDTEVILGLYATEGRQCVKRLRGMYAFALWDASREELLLARDPFGIKPLYYADDGATLRAASQVRALLRSPAIDTRPEPAGHTGFFLWGYVPDPYTLFRGIRALPAGHLMRIERGGRREIERFCDIGAELARYAAAGAEPDTGHDAGMIERLHAALADSVRHHMLADVPVGLFLSSGLDSSVLAGLAARHTGEPLRAVTLGFAEFRATAADETLWAAKVAHTVRARHDIRWVKRCDFEAESERLFAAMDQPSTDGVNTYFVAKAAAAAGLKVALSGLGGDELFAGYPSFNQIPRLVGMMGRLPIGRVAGGLVRRVVLPVLSRFTSPKYAGLFEYGAGYAGAYLLRRSLFMPWELDGLLDPEMARAGWSELQPLDRLGEGLDQLPSARLKVSVLEMTRYMRSQLLRDSDWAGMAHSLEIRVPFVDLELLRSIAPLLAGSRPPGKREMAISCWPELPPELLGRPKSGFSVPVRDWLMRNGHGGAERGLRGWARLVYRLYAQSIGRPGQAALDLASRVSLPA